MARKRAAAAQPLEQSAEQPPTDAPAPAGGAEDRTQGRAYDEHGNVRPADNRWL